MRRTIPLVLTILLLVGFGAAFCWQRYVQRRDAFHPVLNAAPLIPADRLSSFQKTVLADLERQKRVVLQYQDGYYAGGEPSAQIGVCTDVVIRAFRAAERDLQREVTADIKARSAAYGIAKPDPNIDHRRCRNLVRYFEAHSNALPTGGAKADWQPGDIIFWGTWGNGKVDHVGLIANGKMADGPPTVVHHWPGHPVAETDGLFRFSVRYHFREKQQ